MCNWDRQLNANSEVGFQLLTVQSLTDLIDNIIANWIRKPIKAVRVPDEGKLPVSWLAGNQGEYATSTEVTMVMVMVVKMPMFMVSWPAGNLEELLDMSPTRHCGPCGTSCCRRLLGWSR